MLVYQDPPEAEKRILAEKYCPLLVLYPEIGGDKKERKDHYHADNYNSSQAPLDQDYHPRDIRLILDNVWVPKRIKEKGEELKREYVLTNMSEKKLKYMHLIDKWRPKHPDKYWDRYWSIEDRDKNYPRTAYVRILKGTADRFKNFISIQYWMAYFFNDWHNLHEMDWEMVSVIIRKDDSKGELEEPIVCVYNAHMNSYVMPWKDVEKVKDNEIKEKNPDGSHPVVYVASGSHASYFYDYPSSFNVASPLLSDNLVKMLRSLWEAERLRDHVMSFEDGEKHFPNLKIIPPDNNGCWTKEWRWLNFEGRWGSAPLMVHISDYFSRRFKFFKLYKRLTFLAQRTYLEAGPYGPRMNKLCWNDPLNWVNLECYDARISDYWIGEGCDKHSRKGK